MERKKLNIWTASSFFIFLTYLVFLVYPIVTVLKQALIHEGQFSLANFVTFFSKAYYSETLVNSFKVSITATVTSLVVGTLLAYLFSMYDFKGKKFLQIFNYHCFHVSSFCGSLLLDSLAGTKWGHH